MWNESIVAINKYLSVTRIGEDEGTPATHELWYAHADMNTGKRADTTYGALDAFFPAVLALSGDLNKASLLQESSFKMWMKEGIEPEEFDYQAMTIKSPGYPLRPEIVESTYYLFHYAEISKSKSFRRGTRPSSSAQVPPLNGSAVELDPNHYQQMGETMWRDFVKYCRTDEGYAALKSVVSKEKSDSMQSFLFAETFKYFYLLFASPRTLDFDSIIFNTEAHPIRRK